MFLLNSCLNLFSAACISLYRLPLSRSYGDILPSSLTMLLPSALGFSPHPPVSVYGTGRYGSSNIVAFLDRSLRYFATLISLLIISHLSLQAFLLYQAKDFYQASLLAHLCSLCPHMFCPYPVQEYQPAVHRLRRKASS